MRYHNNLHMEVKIIQDESGYTVKIGESDVTVKEFSLLVQLLSESFDLLESDEELFITPVKHIKRKKCLK